MSEDTITISEAAATYHRTVKHLQLLDRTGKLPSHRTSTNRRWYYRRDLDAYFGIPESPATKRRPFVYCRVSSAAQKPDLANQKRVLGDFCAARGLADVQWIEEVGGGLNFERKKFLQLMDAVERREVSHLVIAHKDRLTRFGFAWFRRLCETHGCEVLVLNNETMSPEREMVEDLMTIVHCFSSRLYGLRNYRKKLIEALQADAQDQAPDEAPDEASPITGDHSS